MTGPVAPQNDGRDESRAERMDRNWVELLQELRVLQTEVQILAGFLVTLAEGPGGETTMTEARLQRRATNRGGTTGKWVKEDGLLLANAALFIAFFGGMVLSGAASYSEDQLAHGQPAVGVLLYLGTGAFVEATFENWESEFLHMGMYVLLTVFLFQKGSSESKPMGRAAPQDDDSRQA